MAKRHSRPSGGSSATALKAREREELAVKLRLEGWTLGAIAEKIGYKASECARVAILRAMAKMPPIEDLVALRQHELDKLDEIEREAWEQWYRSTQDAESRTEAETKDGTFVTERKEGQSGNPALLDKIIKASERRAKLLGLDAPEKLAVSGNLDIDVFGQKPSEVFSHAAKEAAKAEISGTGD